MFDFKKSIFLGLTIISSTMLSNNDTQTTSKNKYTQEGATVDSELENNFKKDVVEQFESVANAIKENVASNQRANGIVVAHVNELAKKMNLRFKETEKNISSLDDSVTTIQQDINAIKEKLPKLATTEFVQSTANRIDDDAEKLTKRVYDLPTKQWVKAKIEKHDTKYDIKLEALSQQYDTKFEALTRQVESLTPKKPEPGNLPVIPIDAYNSTSAQKIYSDASTKQAIETFNDHQSRANWKTRQSTIDYLSRHKTSVLLGTLIAFVIGEKLIVIYNK